MEAEQRTHFRVDKSKCMKCGRCINVCSGMVYRFWPGRIPANEGI